VFYTIAGLYNTTVVCEPCHTQCLSWPVDGEESGHWSVL